MKILKKIGKIILGFLFLISFSLLIVIYSTEKITSYSSLKNIAVPILEKQINISEEEKEMFLSWLIEKCKNQNELLLNFGENITISCSETLTINKENLQQYIAHKIFDTFYFKKYSCVPLECLRENTTFLLSATFNHFVSSLFLPILLTTVLLMTTYFLLIETWEERLLNAAFLLLLSSTPIFFFDYFISYIFPKISLPENISSIILFEIKKNLNFLYYMFYLSLLLLAVYFSLLIKKKLIKRKIK